MKADALDWLLEPRDPPIRYHTLVDVLGYSPESKEATTARQRIYSYRPYRKIVRAQTKEGYWPPADTCYQPKFTATVWPLILLGEMAAPGDPPIKKACERFLDLHQMENGAFSCPSNQEEKRWREKLGGAGGGGGGRGEEPCLTGNMIRTLIVFGYGEDPRVRRAIEWMPNHQQEDGGWNCDYPLRQVKHSSFMSTIEPLWAYSEIPRPQWTRKMKHSIEQGAEFLLMHHVYKSDHNDWRPTEIWPTKFWGETITKFHFPMYYYYDTLHCLRVLAKLGYGDDERVRDAVHLVLSKKTPDGRWLLEGDWLREWKGKTRVKRRRATVNIEHLMKPSKWVTLNCYRALLGTGDLEVPKAYAR